MEDILMTLFLNILLLLVGFILLIKGADFFVEGSSAAAKLMKIPSVIVGVTIVSMGTSLPELAVSTSAALNGSNEIAVSNVIGSNLFNSLVVLGVAAIIAAVPVKSSLLKCEFPLNLLITAMLGLFGADLLMKGKTQAEGLDFIKNANEEMPAGTLGRGEGIALLVIFILYLTYTVFQALKSRKETLAKEAAGEIEKEDKPMPVWRSIIYIIGGIIAIKFGGDFVVDSARVIAKFFGMSETLIGLTIVACGTSLPELVTSAVASKKGENDIAVGNVIGSNIFNILFILGVSATITPISVISGSIVDTIVLFFVSALMFLFCGTRKEVKRTEGITMVIIYIIYLTYIIMR
jgi:cation:H+ antiporter